LKIYDVIRYVDGTLTHSYGLFLKKKQAVECAKHLNDVYKKDYGHLNNNVEHAVIQRLTGEIDFYDFKPEIEF
jgi:hypothetical protein